MNTFDLSLIVTCYNEEPHLAESIRRVVQVLDDTRWRYEIIFVDDCSTDATRSVIEKLISQYEDKRFRSIFHERNIGRGGAVTDGIYAAQGRVVGFLDIDLEVSPHYIPAMIRAIEDGCDIAVGRRIYKLRWLTMHRHILSMGYVWLVRRLLGVGLRDTETGYKFFRRSSILPILDEIEDRRWFWDTEIMVRSILRNLTITEIPCLFLRRDDKRSTVRLWRDTTDYFRKLWLFRRTVREIRSGHRAIAQERLHVSHCAGQ